jgi:hypothetical protein
LRVQIGATADPTWMRVVDAAIAAIEVVTSRRKLSASMTAPNPAASAT